MSTQLKKIRRRSDSADYGFARVRDKAFDAVHTLWRKRKTDGVMLKDVADKIGRDPGWVSKQLSGPGNWTLRTFGELVEGLDGEPEIQVFDLNSSIDDRPNYDAYLDFDDHPATKITTKFTFDNPPKLTPKATTTMPTITSLELVLEPISA